MTGLKVTVKDLIVYDSEDKFHWHCRLCGQQFTGWNTMAMNAHMRKHPNIKVPRKNELQYTIEREFATLMKEIRDMAYIKPLTKKRLYRKILNTKERILN